MNRRKPLMLILIISSVGYFIDERIYRCMTTSNTFCLDSNFGHGMSTIQLFSLNFTEVTLLN